MRGLLGGAPVSGRRRLRLLAASLAVAVALLAAPSPALAAQAGSAAALDDHVQAGVAGFSSAISARAENREPSGEVTALAASERISLPVDAVYSWIDGYLEVDGLVTNDTSASVGPIEVMVTVETQEGGVLQDRVSTFAAAYRLDAGKQASFTSMFWLPEYAGSALNVLVSAVGEQPSIFPGAVDLTLVSRTMSVQDGVRVYSCIFRNDTRQAVEAPVVGGWEKDAEGLMDSPFGYDSLAIAPGSSWAVDVYGFAEGTPTDAYLYAQALPVTPTYLPVYRFYNRLNGSHFYTASLDEANTIILRWAASYAYEGTAYSVNTADPANSAPLYRFYNRRNGSHFYTASLQEANTVIALWSATYSYEGAAYNVCATPVPGAQPVFRFFNRNNGSHFYTTSADERDIVIARWPETYSYEGAAFWIAP